MVKQRRARDDDYESERRDVTRKFVYYAAWGYTMK